MLYYANILIFASPYIWLCCEQLILDYEKDTNKSKIRKELEELLNEVDSKKSLLIEILSFSL